MTVHPTGRLERTPDGRDLILTRSYRAPIEDVWASITESDRTARWFGPWQGEAAPGRGIRVQMVHEDEQPWADYTIDSCEPPRHLALRTVDEYGSWHLEVTLTEANGRTELLFVHHLDSADKVTEVGPGWEYYLDALGAARSGRDHPDFDDYYPAMRDYYATLAD